MTTHDLKCWPGPFQAVKQGIKTLELRYNDRDYQVGDYLHLREFVPIYPGQRPGKYTGDSVLVQVTHVLRGFTGLEPGYVAMSITLMEAK